VLPDPKRAVGDGNREDRERGDEETTDDRDHPARRPSDPSVIDRGSACTSGPNRRSRRRCARSDRPTA
jgi:hypothetical protein